MNIIFFDLPELRSALKPFTLTRPVVALRVGILTLQEKWGAKSSQGERSGTVFSPDRGLPQ